MSNPLATLHSLEQLTGPCGQITVADAAALAQAEAAVASAKREIAPLEASMAGLRERAAELEAAVEAAGGTPLRNKRAEIAQLQKVCHNVSPKE